MTLQHQSIELDTLEILVDVVASLTAMVAVNPKISSETVSNRLLKEQEEGAVQDGKDGKDGTKVVELHILQNTVMMKRATMQRQQSCEQPISSRRRMLLFM